MAFHIFRRQAVSYWRRRTPRALAKVLGRQHLSMSLQTTNRAAARRLATQVNLFLDDVAMLADGTDQLSRSQIETMLHAVVEKQVAKLDRVAFAAKNAPVLTSTRRGRTTGGLVDLHAARRPRTRRCRASGGSRPHDRPRPLGRRHRGREASPGHASGKRHGAVECDLRWLSPSAAMAG